MAEVAVDSAVGVEEVVEVLAQWCASFDPATIPADRVDPLFDALASIAKLADGALTRLTPRYERTGVWRDRGEVAAADAVARRCGTSLASARRRIDLARAVERSEPVAEALAGGSLSVAQAEIVVAAAPSADLQSLLDGARTMPLAELRRTVAATHSDEDIAARHQRVHRRRSARRWTDADGSWNLHIRCLPEWGAEIDARLKSEVDRTFTQARREGRTESIDAYTADALHHLICGAPEPLPTSGSRRRSAVRPERKVIATIDVAALRGTAPSCPGGAAVAHIAGVGPVPAATARALLGDATLAIVIRDGIDVLNVTHLGRAVTAHQRTALEARGYRCEIEGCGRTHHLEIDHVTGWALTRTTQLSDLAWLCTHHHGEKSRRGLLLHGPPGRRMLRPPSALADSA